MGILEISAIKDNDRGRRIRWLFVGWLLGLIVGGVGGLMWRAWVEYPPNPGFAVEFYIRLFLYQSLDAVSFWHLFPDSQAVAWARRVVATLGQSGVARQIEHLWLIVLCAVGGSMAGMALIAAVSGPQNKQEKECDK